MGDTKNTVKEQDFQVIDGGKGADNKDTIKINKLKVFKSELVNVEYLNADDLFSEFDSISFRQSTTSIGATHRMGVGECHTTYWFLIYSCTICKLFSLTVVTK